MNTGHDGSLTTLHANSPQDVLDRMVTMVRYAVDLPVDAIEAQVGSAFDFIVQVSRYRDGSRFLSDISQVAYDRAARACVMRSLFHRAAPDAPGAWSGRPEIMDDVLGAGLASEEEVCAWERSAYGA